MMTSIARGARFSSPSNRTIFNSLFRYSFNLLKQNFSSTSTSSSSSKKPKRKTKKNLFEVAQFLPNWGIGYYMAKSHWTNVSYEITKINLYKDGRHGKAWGIAYKDGLPAADGPKKISGVHKRCWKYIPSLSKKSLGGISDSPESTATTRNTEVQTA